MGRRAHGVRARSNPSARAGEEGGTQRAGDARGDATRAETAGHPTPRPHAPPPPPPIPSVPSVTEAAPAHPRRAGGAVAWPWSKGAAGARERESAPSAEAARVCAAHGPARPGPARATG